MHDNLNPEAGESEVESSTATATETNDNEKNSRHTEGDPLTFVRVRFPGNAKSQPFLVGSRYFQYGQKVLAMSDRGMTVGYINSFPYEVSFKKDMLPLKSISKIATDEDIEEQKSFIRQERDAENLCKRLIENYKLDMNITHVEFIQFGKKAVFYFNAPARVDFRDLVKSLVGELKMRIELRQISVRDRTAALGAIGSCGLQTCCSSFLKNYGNVNIKMAKNQNLALIPSKLNGVCGQIKCCIKYEDNVYAEKRQRLPREFSFIKVANGDIGKVTRLHILIEQFEMLTDKGVFKRYALNQFDKKLELPSGWKFPDRFDHITNETSEIIGLVEDDLVRGELYYDNVDDFNAEEYLESLGDENEEAEEMEEIEQPVIETEEDNEPNFNREEFNKSEEIDARDNKRLGNRSRNNSPRGNSNGPNNANRNKKKSKNNRNRNNNENRKPRTPSDPNQKQGEGNKPEGQTTPNRNKNRNRNRNRNRNKPNTPGTSSTPTPSSDGGGEKKDS